MGILIGALIRLIISGLSLLLVGALISGFTIGGFVNALIVALVIAILGYLIELISKSKQGKIRGVVGFIISAIVIYIAQFIISALTVTVIGALLAAVIIGIIDMIVPTFKINEIFG